MYHTSDKVIILIGSGTLEECLLDILYLIMHACFLSVQCTGGGVMMNLGCPVLSLGKSTQIHEGQEFWGKCYFSQGFWNQGVFKKKKKFSKRDASICIENKNIPTFK